MCLGAPLRHTFFPFFLPLWVNVAKYLSSLLKMLLSQLAQGINVKVNQ